MSELHLPEGWRRFDATVSENGVMPGYWRPAATNDEPLLLALHGFTGSGLDFALPASHDTDRTWRWVCPDLPGHDNARTGPDVTMHLSGWIADCRSLIDVFLTGPKPSLLGYSMGGRLALHLAIAYPEVFANIIVIGARLGPDTPSECNERVSRDHAWADLLNREGLTAFLRAWQSQPLIASQQNINPQWLPYVKQIRENQHPGELAKSIVSFSPGRIPVASSDLRAIADRLHFVAGEHDSFYRGLGSKLYAEGYCSSFSVIPDAGHAAHLENPGAFIATTKRLS